MYIDFHKYNYSLVDAAHLDAFIKRDKEAYYEALKKWFNENVQSISDRKWEIEDIGYLTQVSDFIKLIREGETLYELGLFTSCIALVGVSAEDFSKYLSFQLGRNDHLQTTNRRGRTVDVSQNDRLQAQLLENIINQQQFDLLDDIRKKRNDCLHYNQNFKLKNNQELKDDALKCLNNLKRVIKDMLGVTGSPEDITAVIEGIIRNEGIDTKNKDDMRMKVRNAMSHLFEFPVAFDPERKYVVKDDYFLIIEIDYDYNEITIAPLVKAPGYYVIVELKEEVKRIIEEQNIQEKDTVYAVITSRVSDVGMTEEWNFIEIEKDESIGELFKERINELWIDKSATNE